jgi:hypothetical protein
MTLFWGLSRLPKRFTAEDTEGAERGEVRGKGQTLRFGKIFIPREKSLPYTLCITISP